MFDDIPEAEEIRDEYIDWFPDYKRADRTYDVNDAQIQKDLADYKEKYSNAIKAMVELEKSYVELDSLYDAWTERNEY